MTVRNDGIFVYIGTQGQGPDQGIHVARFDQDCGRLIPLGLAAVGERPTWVLADPERPILYAVSEVGNAGDRIGDVTSFAVDRMTGHVTLLNTVPSGGGGPTHLAIGPEGSALFVANFGGGQAAVLPISPDGSLRHASSVLTGSGSGPHRRQKGPHAHGVTLDPSGRFLLVPDMGADRIFVYAWDRARLMIEDIPDRQLAVPAGAGPRLLLFGQGGRFAYLLTELSAEIFIFAWDAEAGVLVPAGSVALDPPGHEGERSAAGFAMSADGRFLYATNRVTHMIHVFAIGACDGGLTPVQIVPAGGQKPWAVELVPGGGWLFAANQASGTVCLFQVDPASGCLTPAGDALAVPAPTSLAFTAAGE